MKKTFKQQIREFWNENKRVIKVGLTFGALGFIYGFTKGVVTNEHIWIDTLQEAVTNAETSNEEAEVTVDGNSESPEL